MGACISASTDNLAKQHSHPDPFSLQTLNLSTSPTVADLTYGIQNITQQNTLKFNHAPLKNSKYLFNKFHSNESPQEINLQWQIHSIDLTNNVLNVALVNLVEVGLWVVWGGKPKILGTGLVVALENYTQCEYVRIEKVSKVGKQNLLHFVAPQQKLTQVHLILESLAIAPVSPCTLSLLSTYKISPEFHESPSFSEKNIPLVLESQTMTWNNLSFVLQKIYNQDESELNARIKNQTQCIVCLSLISDCILVPCRHMCLCQECIQNVGVGKGIQACPLCKTPIEEIVVYKD